jgi:hypothetical protein
MRGRGSVFWRVVSNPKRRCSTSPRSVSAKPWNCTRLPIIVARTPNSTTIANSPSRMSPIINGGN